MRSIRLPIIATVLQIANLAGASTGTSVVSKPAFMKTDLSKPHPAVRPGRSALESKIRP